MHNHVLFFVLLSKCCNPGILFSKCHCSFSKQDNGGFFLFPEQAETPVEEHIVSSATNYGATLDKTAVEPVRQHAPKKAHRDSNKISQT